MELVETCSCQTPNTDRPVYIHHAVIHVPSDRDTELVNSLFSEVGVARAHLDIPVEVYDRVASHPGVNGAEM